MIDARNIPYLEGWIILHETGLLDGELEFCIFLIW